MDFQHWLKEELNHRGWSHSQLSRRAGISQAAISNVLSGERRPGCDFCVKIAAALDLSPVLVLIKAGILSPQSPDDDPALTELSELIRSLSPDQRLEVIRYIKFLRHK